MLVEKIVLDSWAILAWLQKEDQGLIVKDLLNIFVDPQESRRKVEEALGIKIKGPKVFLSLINLGEIFYIIGRRKGEKTAQKVVQRLKSSPIEIVPVYEKLVLEAGRIKMKHPVAYADAFALATAKAKSAFLLTGDPELGNVEGAPILWIGRK